MSSRGLRSQRPGWGYPILIRGEVNGVISLQNMDNENAFPSSDIDLLTTLTNSMSLFLENGGCLLICTSDWRSWRHSGDE